MPVHVFQQKAPDRLVGAYRRRRKPDQRRALRPHVLDARDPRRFDPPPALGDRILDKKRDQPAHELVNGTRRFEAGIKRRDLAGDVTEKIDLANLGKIDQARAQTVVEVMRVIGDAVGECRGLCLGAGEMRKFEIMNRIIFKDRRGKSAFRITPGHPAGPQERAVMFDEPFQGLPSQIESIEGRVAGLELGDDAQRLGVVIEAAVRSHQFVEHILASVAKRRVAKVMRKRKRLGEIVVEAERAGKRARDLAHLQRMGEPGTEMVALVRNEDLRLVGEPPEGGAMDDAVAVALKCRARRRMRLRDQPSAASCRIGGVRRARGDASEGGRKVAICHENLDCAARLIAEAGLPTYLTYFKGRQARAPFGPSAPFEVVKMSEATAEAAVEVTENAARRIAEILTSEPAGSFLRIGVDGGGCSGFTYTYNLSTERSGDDLVIERDGAIVAIDSVSLDLLRGSRIDFIDDVMGRMFKIENPAATASCGCGTSFAI
jgi:iron-sulfur cluster assembly accessory protein